MKHLSMLGAAVVTVVLLTAGGPAANAAQWCAQYNDGGSNCGFYTRQQCLQTVRGIGGSCQFNGSEYWYAPARHDSGY
jgi:hypothetical protein